MKIISFVRKGQTSFGAVVSGGIIDLGGSLGNNVYCLNAALTAGLWTMRCCTFPVVSLSSRGQM